jgi:hypothetical protein
MRQGRVYLKGSAPETPHLRRARWYGTKRYAVVEVRRQLRAYAKATRLWATDTSKRWSIEHDWATALGCAMGVVYGFHAIGALTQEQYERACRRLERISARKVTRRPFGELRSVA